MGMDFVVVVDPSVDEPERHFGVWHCCDADVIPLRGLDEGFRHAVRLRTGNGVKQGVRLTAWANSLVSLAV